MQRQRLTAPVFSQSVEVYQPGRRLGAYTRITSAWRKADVRFTSRLTLLFRQLHRQYIDLFDLRSFGEQLRGVSHQRCSDGTRQMGLPARVVGEGIENAK